MMKAMVDKFNKTNDKNEALKEAVKQKNTDIVGLATCVVGEYERATLKARYELLKAYKQGLLVDLMSKRRSSYLRNLSLKPELRCPSPVQASSKLL
ncbi:hypothetical protein TIFTF001_020406 [Ficus carica]|uniref:Uncharacterized protein n=1 Tax=Ficus carica TaxID=3494 RepID=A0AA88D9S7_FICCA|nr:hypothetical protein TIFTF001_020406 [Ficus carica]